MKNQLFFLSKNQVLVDFFLPKNQYFLQKNEFGPSVFSFKNSKNYCNYYF